MRDVLLGVERYASLGTRLSAAVEDRIWGRTIRCQALGTYGSYQSPASWMSTLSERRLYGALDRSLTHMSVANIRKL